jgi:hypothetical protein
MFDEEVLSLVVGLGMLFGGLLFMVNFRRLSFYLARRYPSLERKIGPERASGGTPWRAAWMVLIPVVGFVLAGVGLTVSALVRLA